MIVVIGKLTLKPGHNTVFMDGWADLVAEYRKESGCISYEVVQVVNNANLCYMVSKWNSEEDYERHLASPPYQKAYTYSIGFLAKVPEIDRCVVAI